MENLNIRDTKRKEILPKKKKQFQFLMKMPATPTRLVFFPKKKCKNKQIDIFNIKFRTNE